MEPISIVAISAAVGGAAGKLAEKAWDSGEKWLSKYFEDHHPKAIKKAQRNALAFIDDLSHRVKQLEETADDTNAIKERITSALEDPDFSAILKDSLMSSSRTENKDTHKVLSRLVSERLNCKSGDLLALTIPLACESVKSLTNNQLRFLAVGFILEYLMPNKFQNTSIDVDNTIISCMDWFKKELPLILPDNPMTGIDLKHLVGNSCIHLTKTIPGGAGLFETLVAKLKIPQAYFSLHMTSLQNLEEFIEKTEDGKRLRDCWDRKLSHIMLTSSGILIGICVFDELTENQTDMMLYFNNK